MTDHIEPRNRAERRAASRRTRKVAALGSGAILAMGVAGTATTLLSAAPAGAAAPRDPRPSIDPDARYVKLELSLSAR